MPETIAAALHEWFMRTLLALTPLDVAWIGIATGVMFAAKHAGMWVYALVTLPGTFAHELAHFLVALLLGARPSFPSLIPQRTQRGWRLGSVAFHVGRLRAMPIALAPLLLLPLALWWAATFLHTAWPWYAAHVWIVAALLGASVPSRTDWKIALPALGALALLLAALLLWIFRGG